jgi:hypothetical protein
MNKPVTNARVTRWLLLLQEFNITIIDRPGRDNLVVDFLSRLIHTGDSTPVDDDFPDENLFSISTYTPWYADVANYLVTLTKSYNLAIIGQPFLKMQRNMWPAAMIAKEWENLHQSMKCHSKPK